ncbi:hypothetical protein AVEN_172033-1, partial [Araneus ventricosus]
DPETETLLPGQHDPETETLLPGQHDPKTKILLPGHHNIEFPIKCTAVVVRRQIPCEIKSSIE